MDFIVNYKWSKKDDGFIITLVKHSELVYGSSNGPTLNEIILTEFVYLVNLEFIWRWV